MPPLLHNVAAVTTDNKVSSACLQLEARSTDFHIEESEVLELREQIGKLEKRNHSLEEALETKDETTNELSEWKQSLEVEV